MPQATTTAPVGRPPRGFRPCARRGAPHIARAPLAMLFCLLLVIVGVMPHALASPAVADEAVHLERGEKNRYDSYSTTWLYADGAVAYCGTPSLNTPASGDYVKDYNVPGTGASGRDIEAYLFYGYGGPGFDPTKYWPTTWYDGSEMNADRYAALTHIMLSESYLSDNGDSALYGCSAGFKKWVREEVIGFARDDNSVNYQCIGHMIRDSAMWGGHYHGLADMPDDFKVFMVATGPASQVIFACEPYGWIEVGKSSAASSITSQNPLYSLAGAEYAVLDASGAEVARVAVDASGHADAVQVPAGTYSVVEQTAPQGYALDGTPHQVTVGSGATEHVVVSDVPQACPVGLVVSKTDAETGGSLPLGGASLAGAEFQLDYYSGFYTVGNLPRTPTRSWRLATDDDGRASLDEAHLVSGDALYTLDGKTVLPLGTVALREVKAPRGYLPATGEATVAQITAESGAQTAAGFVAAGVPEQVVRGDIDLIKVEAQTQNRLAGVPFSITSQTTGETHVIVTDENGYASTHSDWNPHSQATNVNDEGGEGTWDASAGVWFGVDAQGLAAPVDDSLGALPFDTYRIEELRCQANEGLQLLDTTIVISRDSRTVSLGTVSDNPGPRIATQLVDAEGNHSTMAGESVRLVDTVAYEHLSPGTAYTLSGVLVDSATAQPVCGSDGEPVTARTEFTPTTASGTVEVAFSLDASQLAGTSVVAFERLECESELIASHEDAGDAGQTVSFPRIGTSASNPQTGGHEVPATSQAVVVDSVEYEGLVPGTEYELAAVLVDQSTGEVLALADGSAAAARCTFTPQEPSGSQQVVISCDATALSGKTAVVFESLLLNGSECARHADTGDEAQTVCFPSLCTSAADAVDGDRMLRAASDARIVDSVTCSNLEPGAAYRVIGTLVDPDTGEPWEDASGSAATGSVELAAEGADAVVEVPFEFNATGCEGRALVVVEQLVRDGTVMAEHRDLLDADQTVRFPRITTTAAGSETSDHLACASQSALIVDRVRYEGLEPGRSYLATGTLIDKATERPVEVGGRPVESAVSFEATQPDGFIDVPFELDATALAGTDTVVFERIESDGVPVAEHADPSSTDQTIHWVSLSTTARDAADGDKVLEAASAQRVIDTVSYQNLIPGKTYEVTGVLMDKADGSVVHDDAGKAVEARAEFTPEQPDGSVEVEFSFDASGLASHDLVAFETLLCEGAVVGEHADIGDAAQTVRVSALKPALGGRFGKTGASLGPWVALACALAAATILGATRAARRMGPQPPDGHTKRGAPRGRHSVSSRSTFRS